LAQYATGPVSGMGAAIAIPLSWVGAPVPEKIISARQTFKTTNQDFIRALANNKRYPVAEMNRIREEINLIPTFLDDPKLMRLRMISIRDDLERRMLQAERDGKDTTQTPDYRAGAKKAEADIRNYLAVLGEPSAPKAAVEDVLSNPNAIIDGKPNKIWFKEKYGYLPEGINE
jgi:hypothetical protein